MHHIPLTDDAPDALFSRFGRELPAAWQAHLNYNLEALNPADPLLEWGVYAAGDQARLRSLVRDLGQLPTRFGLNHGDLSLRNVLVPDTGDPVLIDWGSSAAGPTPFGDLLNVFKVHRATGDPSMAELTAFAEGCGLRLDAVLPSLQQLLILSLLDLVRWAADRRPDLLAGHVAAARTGIAGRLGRRPRPPAAPEP